MTRKKDLNKNKLEKMFIINSAYTFKLGSDCKNVVIENNNVFIETISHGT